MADFIMILGYLGWLRVLLLQTKKAAETFWQASLEKDSLVIQFFTAVLFSFILFSKSALFKTIIDFLFLAIYKRSITTMIFYMQEDAIWPFRKKIYTSQWL